MLCTTCNSAVLHLRLINISAVYWQFIGTGHEYIFENISTIYQDWAALAWQLKFQWCSPLISTDKVNWDILRCRHADWQWYISLSCSNHRILYVCIIFKEQHWYWLKMFSSKKPPLDENHHGIVGDAFNNLICFKRAAYQSRVCTTVKCIIVQFCPRRKDRPQKFRSRVVLNYYCWKVYLFILLGQQVSEIVFKLRPRRSTCPSYWSGGEQLATACAGWGLGREEGGQHFLSQLFRPPHTNSSTYGTFNYLEKEITNVLGIWPVWGAQQFFSSYILRMPGGKIWPKRLAGTRPETPKKCFLGFVEATINTRYTKGLTAVIRVRESVFRWRSASYCWGKHFYQSQYELVRKNFGRNKNTECLTDAHCHRHCREDPRIKGLHWCQNPAEALLGFSATHEFWWSLWGSMSKITEK